jgi:hypothetical protein
MSESPRHPNPGLNGYQQDVMHTEVRTLSLPVALQTFCPFPPLSVAPNTGVLGLNCAIWCISGVQDESIRIFCARGKKHALFFLARGLEFQIFATWLFGTFSVDRLIGLSICTFPQPKLNDLHIAVSPTVARKDHNDSGCASEMTRYALRDRTGYSVSLARPCYCTFPKSAAS